jgi:hypothetical protein
MKDETEAHTIERLTEWLKEQKDVYDTKAEQSDFNGLYHLGKASAFNDILIKLQALIKVNNHDR